MKPMSRRTKRIIFSISLLLLAAGYVVWLFFVVPPTTGSPGIAFVGFTNVASGRTVAHFRITNSLGYRALFAVAPVEVEVSAEWPVAGVPAGTGLFEIPQGRITNVFVAFPPEKVRWRLPVGYARVPTRREMWVRSASDFTGWRFGSWNTNMHRVFTIYASPPGS